jgi:uncharacterized repeat protein (TIGR03803 family)
MKPPARQERVGPGRLNKFGGPNLFTLDTVKWGRAKAREAPHLTGSSAAWATGTTGATIKSKIIVENRTGAGNTGFGITTLGFSPSRVTVSFGARRLNRHASDGSKSSRHWPPTIACPQCTRGTVFKMTPAGVLTTLVPFNGANGRDPQAPLVKGSDGNFYGTTEYGGPGGAGTVFQMTPAGVLKTLVAFGGRTKSP